MSLKSFEEIVLLINQFNVNIPIYFNIPNNHSRV